MSRVLKFRAFFNGQMSNPFTLGEGVCWPGGRVSTANKIGDIMKFTGLLDKNGKEIYEGDIFEAPHDFGPAGFQIRRGTVHFCKVDGYQWEYWDLSQLEVIGNIHEHPHLIESE